jgi:hypothetical protein
MPGYGKLVVKKPKTKVKAARQKPKAAARPGKKKTGY